MTADFPVGVVRQKLLSPFRTGACRHTSAFNCALQVPVKDTAVPGEPLCQLTFSRSSQANSYSTHLKP